MQPESINAITNAVANFETAEIGTDFELINKQEVRQAFEMKWLEERYPHNELNQLIKELDNALSSSIISAVCQRLISSLDEALMKLDDREIKINYYLMIEYVLSKNLVGSKRSIKFERKGNLEFMLSEIKRSSLYRLYLGYYGYKITQSILQNGLPSQLITLGITKCLADSVTWVSGYFDYNHEDISCYNQFNGPNPEILSEKFT